MAPFAHWFLRFFLMLFGRHWLMGVANLGLTALLGLGLVRTAERWQLFRSQPRVILHLRHAVLSVALLKGALFLVLGEIMQSPTSHNWVIGLQLPDPAESLGLLAQTGFSIWHPTEISRWVVSALGSVASLLFLYRLAQLVLARRAFRLWVKISQATSSDRVNILLVRAAQRMRLPPDVRLPEVIETVPSFRGASSQTPQLIGLWHPILLLPISFTELLPDPELEMVLRHELSHFMRRDHWWRWLLLWATDVASLTLFALPVKSAIVEIEEELCDRRAVTSPQEALLLANALRIVSGALWDTKTKSGAETRPCASTVYKPHAASYPHSMASSRNIPWPRAAAGLRPHREQVAPQHHKQSPVGNREQILKRNSKALIPLAMASSLLGTFVTSRQPQSVLRGRLTGLLARSRELVSANTIPDINPAVRLSINWGLTNERAGSIWAAIHRSILWLCLGAIRCIFALLLLTILYMKFHLSLNLR